MVVHQVAGSRSRPGLRSAVSRATALALVATLVAGCGLFGGEETGSAGAPPKVELGTDNHAKGAVAKASQLWRGYDISVDVISLKKYDKAIRLVFAVIPRAKGSTDALRKQTFGSAGVVDGDAGAAYLVDGGRDRVYEHLTIGSGDKAVCACSKVDDDYPLDQPTVLYADFPAVKDASGKLTIVFPVVGPIAGVKVS